MIRDDDTVTWKNTDTQPHQVVSDTNAFPASQVLDPGETYSYRFGTASAYSYHDGRKAASVGTIHVRGTGNSVTIGVSRVFLVYRNPVQISGSVANGRSGESVTVTITRYGGKQETKALTTGTDGIWSVTDRPAIRSEYKASWRNGQSTQAPFVNVRPLVIFRVLSHQANKFYVKVAAQRSYAGRFVSLQRRTNSGLLVQREAGQAEQAWRSPFHRQLPARPDAGPRVGQHCSRLHPRVQRHEDGQPLTR